MKMGNPGEARKPRGRHQGKLVRGFSPSRKKNEQMMKKICHYTYFLRFASQVLSWYVEINNTDPLLDNNDAGTIIRGPIIKHRDDEVVCSYMYIAVVYTHTHICVCVCIEEIILVRLAAFLFGRGA